MAEVFPLGCHLVPDSISEVQDYDENTRVRTPSVDKVTGSRVWQCRVVDLDPELAGRSREVVVKILADRMPVPPTRAPFEPVEFDRLTGHPVRHRQGPPGVLAARHGHEARPPAVSAG